jgi:hypothetical protein
MERVDEGLPTAVPDEMSAFGELHHVLERRGWAQSGTSEVALSGTSGFGARMLFPTFTSEALVPQK